MGLQSRTTQQQILESRYLTFMLGSEYFGIPISVVKEVLNLLPITAMPEMPKHMKGTVQLREKAVPAIDMRMRMNKPEKSYDDNTCMVVLSDEGKEFAFIIDAVDEVIEIDAQDIAIPKFNFGQGENLICGVGKTASRFVLLLDSQALLQNCEYVAANS